jgi:hypothetical protein
MSALHLATFHSDITPPLGHPLCGGWIEPARRIVDPLKSLGVILLGTGQPVVLCALDWCGLRNEAYEVWRAALAKAVHTHPDRVALQCVHPHDAPFADLEAERLLRAVPGAPSSLDPGFFEKAVAGTAASALASISRTSRLTHFGIGQARVERVASNRRVLTSDGHLKYWRGSKTGDPLARAEPEGLIDPWLKCLSFWDGPRPLAAMYYYATHPMSHYGQGEVSSDFCGLARQRRQEEEPAVLQIYFTGCAGNIAAGKYNDGAPGNRLILRDRMHPAMLSAWRATQKHACRQFDWRTLAIRLPPRQENAFTSEASRQTLADAKESKVRRINAAMQLAWLERSRTPISVSCLDLGPALVAHLPGEPFIEYQLLAQKLRADAFVCVAGYGDDGPGYLPTAKAYAEGGYETTVALAGPQSEPIIKQALAELLAAPAATTPRR